MKRSVCLTLLTISLQLLTISCSTSKEKATVKESTAQTASSASIQFDADSAYHYIEQQVAFGPRVPNTEAHVVCGDYLVSKLKSYQAEVIEQKMTVTAYDGTPLKARNIIASFQPENKNRILLFAHWDTRPYADADADEKNWQTPIDGANDGGSGVAVLLELARLLQTNKSNMGVDIIFFDAEDYGTPEWLEDENVESEDTWCLGTQYWTQNPHKPGYKASYGILLDMVGGTNATFRKEQISMHFASYVVNQVWDKASKSGYSSYFLPSEGGVITDDHLYVNQGAKIPSIDIIDYDPARKNGFPDTWHTLDDTMNHISKETLKAVGQTLTNILFENNK
ncbi:MAG: M28 family peptidase [Bacteroidales bacterium]|nr:M28 family peptidase [Bacteroidales bacterium]